ncbi:uncharacterized protein [Venturia canescens]|uniref:uncharacterized protein n=1 Tax=Venturia canescens TaxID=32260 RepID=UPI001C9D2D0F|nr:uncharacterized protein LOC122405751 [Venturia canescens]
MDRRRFNFQRSNEVAAVFSTTADGEIPESEAYTRYRMAIRENDHGNVILLGRLLFQQWAVDNYVKVEKDRIQFIKQNQAKIRAETYSGLVDYLDTTAHAADARVGKIVILPSTFSGSPRNMMQHYQDAMGIVRKFGKPDLFITMTCNPNWREIKENLLPGQQPSDRPDLSARVFDMKKKHLLDLIVRKKFFGESNAFVYTIESQKRGLLHIHLLVTLKNKLSTPEQVNGCISAEIPDPDVNPDLHRIVMGNMIHGPCGAWCEVNGKCSKHFPKPFRNETTMDADAYPYYRRRDTGDTNVVEDTSSTIDGSITAPKYLYKYIFKGHDAAAIQITNREDGENEERVINHDEITDHVEARYVGPNEAIWRIFDKKMQEKSHPVIRLPVHLPNKHNITIPVDMNNDGIRNAMSQIGMLNDYFALNFRDEFARQFIYPDIPSYYVFKRSKVDGQTVCRWEKQQRRHDAFGRMYSVKGAKSFDDLRTINGQVCETFIATCLALGLIEDDDEWKKVLEEAAIWMMPGLLRRLFVRILVHCQPIYPEKLWEEFKEKLSEDYARHILGCNELKERRIPKSLGCL